ncbi:protein-methionine-sulfoxide reductase heme-binding subunit MsrQ [Telmatospirillum sp. J64-1]|uniref:sulfite oxidase heme-binding subunit YedZ n=1 Tax=Telmatospirillum sp. J64-1 TaxID=2502183 RepID=UPI00115CE15B
MVLRSFKPLVFTLCLLPLVWLLWKWTGVLGLTGGGGLGANPIEATNRFLGDWALRFLLIGLAVTPLRLLTGQARVMRYRRMLGLFAFFYAGLHLASYVVLDQFFDWAEIWADISERLYITLGMAAFLLLLPLALTSSAGMIKRLGAARWKRLHLLVYPAAVLAVIHYFLMIKADYTQPLLYACILALLFGLRGIGRGHHARGRGHP